MLCRHIKTEVTIQIGYRSQCRSEDEDGCSRHREARRVLDLTCHGHRTCCRLLGKDDVHSVDGINQILT